METYIETAISEIHSLLSKEMISESQAIDFKKKQLVAVLDQVVDIETTIEELRRCESRQLITKEDLDDMTMLIIQMLGTSAYEERKRKHTETVQQQLMEQMEKEALNHRALVNEWPNKYGKCVHCGVVYCVSQSGGCKQHTGEMVTDFTSPEARCDTILNVVCLC